MFDPNYPPKRRLAEPLPAIRIEIEHAGGVEVLDANGAIILVATQADRIRSWDPVPGRVSDISGQPALLVRTHDLEIALTPAEMARFLNRSLRPQEMFALRDAFGDFYEIHEDAYVPETGEAINPVTELDDDDPPAPAA